MSPPQVIHSDLKARNVLLKSDGSDGRGVVAKVADFGLAIKMDTLGTHVTELQVCVCVCGAGGVRALVLEP